MPELLEQLDETRMMPETLEIRVVHHPFEAAVAQADCVPERTQGGRAPAGKGQAAGQVVVGDGVARAGGDDAAVGAGTGP